MDYLPRQYFHSLSSLSSKNTKQISRTISPFMEDWKLFEQIVFHKFWNVSFVSNFLTFKCTIGCDIFLDEILTLNLVFCSTILVVRTHMMLLCSDKWLFSIHAIYYPIFTTGLTNYRILGNCLCRDNWLEGKSKAFITVGYWRWFPCCRGW